MPDSIGRPALTRRAEERRPRRSCAALESRAAITAGGTLGALSARPSG
jgi:hypothetical protein